MNPKRHIRALLAGLAAALLYVPASLAVPTLWGVDEDDGQLFKIDDYTNPSATFTSYGNLKWNDNGTIREVGNDIEAFTIRSDGMAYMVLDDDIAGQNEPVLMSFDMNTASTTADNVVNVIGRINVTFNTSADDITGIDFDPITGNMYALFEDDDYNNGNDYDRLIEVDPTNGNVLSNRVIYAYGGDDYYGYEVSYLGEDMVFNDNGEVLAIDESDNTVYYVDPLNAQITGTYDADTNGGVGGGGGCHGGGCTSYFEALAWDSENNNLIAFSDNCDFFALITAGNGSNSSYGGVSGLTDVEGLAFWTPGGGGGAYIPTPATLALLVVGGLGMLRLRFRKH